MKTTPLQDDHYGYTSLEVPDQETIDIIKEIPSRWGRMPPLSRLVVVETGRELKRHGLLQIDKNISRSGKTAGLIGGTSKGSLCADLDFARTWQQDPEFASPALFGYTLANIPLAEAANHFGLIGPVYAIIDENNPFQSAIEECRRTFNQSKNIDLMLACHFDHLRPNTNTQQLRITFAIID